MTVAIREDFNHAAGELANYDCFDVDQRNALFTQRHVDIRSFYPSAMTTPATLDDLAIYTMAELDAMTMTQIEALATVVSEGEGWTAGTVGSQADRNHWNGISLTCPIGQTITASVMDPLDLDANFDDDDFISVALPDFPLASLNLTSTVIRFTSSATGDFSAVGENVAVAFNSANLVAPLVSGNTELRFKRQYINTIDLTAVTGVRFEVQATGATTFRALAIRLLDKNWVYAPIDTDTQRDRLVKPVTLTGTATTTSAFPAATSPITPSAWPVLFRATDPSGDDDPRPVDASIGMPFFTGTVSGNNTISLFFREVPVDTVTQLDLDTDGTTVVTQGTLDGLHHQPDYNILAYGARRQSDLDGLTMEDLDGETMASLERVHDYLAASWIEVTLTWGLSGATLSLLNAEGDGYDDPVTLSASTHYYLFAELEDTKLRVRILPADERGILNWTPTYDSYVVNDPSLYLRRRGRVGWYASFTDGDAFVGGFRPHSVTFGEYRSHPLASHTPVAGAQISVESAAVTEGISVVGVGPYGGIVELDTAKSPSGRGWKITTGDVPMQGVATNPFTVENWDTLDLSFDILSPFTEPVFVAYLEGPLRQRIPLKVPPIGRNRWQRVHIDHYATHQYQTGTYSLVLMQATTEPAVWYLDSVSATTRQIDCFARSVDPGASGDNQAVWSPFRSAANNPNGAVFFRDKGRAFQWSAKVRVQDAIVGPVNAKPIYAELGRPLSTEVVTEIPPVLGDNQLSFSWSPALSNLTYTIDSVVYSPDAPRLAVDTAITFTAVGAVPADSGRTIVKYEWDFGDGQTATGSSAVHTFKFANPHVRVSCCMTDSDGTRTCVGRQVYVT